jgi:hypothetical protein
MKPAHVLWDKPTDAGVYSGGSWVPTLPLSSVLTQDLREVARTASTDPADTRWMVDLGRVAPLSMFTILNHSGSKTATRRHRVTLDPAGLETVYDTGAEPLRKPDVLWGSQPFGGFPFDGITDSGAVDGFTDIHITPATVYGRYLWTNIVEPDPGRAWFQLGRCFAGDAFRHRVAFGAKLRPVDPSQVKRTRGGLRVVRRLPGYREMAVSFEFMTRADAVGTGLRFERELGKAGDFLIVLDPDDDPATLTQRTLYAALGETTGVTHLAGNDRYGWGITCEELT